MTAISAHTVHAVIQGTKVGFLGYDYPVLFPFVNLKGVSVADARAIACMKIGAIANCGAKRDFVDLYFSARQHSLGQLLDLFHQKDSQTRHNSVHVLKSLTYFADAEKDPLPAMLVPLSWETVKQFFVSEVPRLL